MNKFAISLLIASNFIAATPLAARVAVERTIMAEREVNRPDGRRTIIIEPARRASPGDRMLVVLRYRQRDAGPAGVVVTSPLPAGLAYQYADGAQVSIDGGARWGKLDQLMVHERDGTRYARPEDVTHVRWTLDEAASRGESHQLVFHAVVR